MVYTKPDNSVCEIEPVHWMHRMLAPKSIAIVGASEKPGSIGGAVMDLLEDCAYPGKKYPVNPRYDAVNGRACYPELAALPESPDLVVMVIGSRAMEVSVQQAIDNKAGGVVIFANNFIVGEAQPNLLVRLKRMAHNAGMPICGGNGMGFYNYDYKTLVSFDSPPNRPGGHIALIAHSGSVMTYLTNTDPRLMFNFVVSPGQEIHGTLADYMLYALAQPSTRVLAVFVEAIRDPKKFVHALNVARDKSIPVVIVKVGATEQSARMAVSHSGAVAGSDAAFQAICDHYGAIRVRDIDELAATAQIFAMTKIPGAGGLSSLLDSGGLRELMIDLAESEGVHFTELTQDSTRQLSATLEFGLVAENPVDAMGALNVDVATVYAKCLRILNNDPGTALLSLEFEFRDGFSQYPQLLEMVKKLYAELDKPLVLINSTVNVINVENAAVLAQLGIPVINGISLALTAIGHGFAWREFQYYESPVSNPVQRRSIDCWGNRISQAGTLDECDALVLMEEFDLPVVPFAIAENLEEVVSGAKALSFPVVLKTAQPGVYHKSDVDGVSLNLTSETALESAYRDLSQRLGNRVLVSAMVEQGVELAIGMINDPQFGPMVMVCAGGIYIEILSDRRLIPAPCSQEEALHAIRSLAVYALLKGARGNPACRIDLAAEAVAKFSLMADCLREYVDEIDLNPVIVTPTRCVIVDGLVVGKYTGSLNQLK